MKIAVVGLGAVGGLIAGASRVRAARSRAWRAARRWPRCSDDGLQVRIDGTQWQAPAHRQRRPARPRPAGPRRARLEGPGLDRGRADAAPLLDERTIVLPAMNGVPWWFLRARSGRRGAEPTSTRRSRASTRAARIAAALPLAQVLGCVVHLSCSSPAPGRRPAWLRQPPDRRRAARRRFGAHHRGLRARSRRPASRAEPSTDIRADIWYKLWGNMTTNPISALTGATTDRILDDPDGARVHAARDGRGGGGRCPRSAARSRSPARSAWW